MTEAEWLDAVDAKARSIDAAPSTATDALQLVEQALAAYPESCRLWNRRGDLIQLLDEQATPYALDEARHSYERACAANPLDPEAYESLGHYFHAVDVQPGEAETMFRKAIDRGASAAAWATLAEVLAGSGRREEASALLSPGACPFAHLPEIAAVRREIEARQ